MCKRIILLLLVLVGLAAQTDAAGKKFTLVIDAGHGGKDAGALGKFSKEKTINLNVALAFGRYVEQNCPDTRVIYTRKTDVFIPLHERADIANKNKADVFVSIHTNSVASKKPISGLETYTMGMRRSDEKLSAAMRENEVILIESDYKKNYSGFDPRSPESMIMFEFINEKNMAESVEMAQLIQKNVCATAGRPNKGVKQDVFLVLRETSMPACLVELGYITTPSEEQYLNNKTNVDAIGRGLYQAFVAYKNKRLGGKSAGRVSQLPPPEPQPAQPEPLKNEVAQAPVPAPPPADTVKQDTTVGQQPVIAPLLTPVADTEDPVFKVQLFIADKKFGKNAAQFKGRTDIDCYREGAFYKYTVGASTNYNEIYRLRKEVLPKFPEAFIIAFRGGQKVNASEALQEFKKKRNIK